MLRSLAFRTAYLLTSTLFVLSALPLLLAPTRAPLARWIRFYARVMVCLMQTLGGAKVEVRGPVPTEPVILASKHQSWGDGFVAFAAVPDLAFVTGDHLLRYPLLGPILRRLGAIIVSACGGPGSRDALTSDAMEAAEREGRSILIYPEGKLSPVGERARYRKGVYHLYARTGRAVVPIATDLGLRWPQARLRMRPGPCTVEFLPAIPPGLSKEVFMARLEEAIETRSLAMLREQAEAGTLPSGVAVPMRAAAA